MKTCDINREVLGSLKVGEVTCLNILDCVKQFILRMTSLRYSFESPDFICCTLVIKSSKHLVAVFSTF